MVVHTTTNNQQSTRTCSSEVGGISLDIPLEVKNYKSKYKQTEGNFNMTKN